MKILFLISRILLGLIFTVFGLNGFFHFIPMAPPPSGPAQEFTHALGVSHFMIVVFLLQIVSGVLLLIGRYVPLALVLIGPVIVNIFLFHSLMAPGGLPLAIIIVILWLVTAYRLRQAFQGLFTIA